MVAEDVESALTELLSEKQDRDLCMCYLKSGGLLSGAECDGKDFLKVSKVARGKVEPFSEQDRNILMLHLSRSRVEERIRDERVSPRTMFVSASFFKLLISLFGSTFAQLEL